MTRRIRLTIAIAGALTLAVTAAGTSSAASRDGSLALVAYSTPKAAYSALIPAFQKTPDGRDVKFSQSFGASTDQARAITQGLPADVANLSLGADVQTLVDAHLVSRNWNRTEHNGIVTESIVTFLVRKGNPKHIRTWTDLIKRGVQIVQPNPISSGGARWDAMAAYGQALAQRQTPKQAQTYLNSYFHNVVSQDKSAAAAMNTFLSGKGDVLVGYESEALPAIAAGNPVQLIRPSYTLLIQNPLVVLGSSQNQTLARSFVHFLLSPPAQTIWAQNGYRPVDPAVAARFRKQFPTPHGVFKITDFGLGGWNAVIPRFFDPANGIVTKIENGL
jgi:sulfate/thiosulfate-binding protein